MTAIQTTEDRVAELIALRDRLDAEIARLHHTTGGGTASKKRPRSVVPECGTESAYQRHRNRGEDCPEGDACKTAHARHERAAAIARDVRRKQTHPPLRSAS